MQGLRARQSVGVVFLFLLLMYSMLSAQNRTASLSQEAACQTLTPAGAGGPMPKDPAVLVVRWLGNANVELAYRDTVILMDAYYDVPREFPLGLTRQDFKRANAILIGHAHSDHISDAADVAQRTGATVIGAAISTDFVRSLGLPEKQTRTVKGGENIPYNGFKVRPILGHHQEFPADVRARVVAADKALAAPPKVLTEAEKRLQEGIRGSRDPKIITEGSISFLLEFENGFRVIYVDTPGPITEGQREIMRGIPSTDLGLFPYSVHRILSQPLYMEFMRLFKPRIALPITTDVGEISLFSLFSTIRNEFPNTKIVSTIYRTPVCININSKEVYVGQY